MVWPPVTHQDIQDEITPLRAAHADYFRPGYYSIGMYTGLNASTSQMTAGAIYARPFEVSARRTFDRIGINIGTAGTAGGLIQMALLQPGAGVPGAALFETSTLSSETTGAKEWVISSTLDPGVWWVTVRPIVTNCSVTAISSGEHNTPFVSAATTPPAATGVFGGYTATASAGFSTAGFANNGAWTATGFCHLGCLRAA